MSFEENGVTADMANDPDPTLSLAGADKGKRLHPAALHRRPYEKPGDANKDNVYEVTVTNVEGVTNVDGNEVTLWADGDGCERWQQLTMAPQVGDTITGAFVMDPDGNVGIPVTGELSGAWQWDPSGRGDHFEDKTSYMMDSFGESWMVTIAGDHEGPRRNVAPSSLPPRRVHGCRR